MSSAHSPSECALEAQAETCVRLGPRTSNCIEICADPAFAISMGTRNGERRDGPRSFMSRTWSIRVSMPPTPVAIATPIRSRSGPPPLSRASSRACAAAPTAYCVNRSVRRTSFRSMYVAGSKPFTSPAICVS
jgi:hypothetical protein